MGRRASRPRRRGGSQAYAKDVLAADFSKPGVGDLVAKMAQDFAEKGIAIEATRIADALQRCATQAKKQIMES